MATALRPNTYPENHLRLSDSLHPKTTSDAQTSRRTGNEAISSDDSTDSENDFGRCSETFNPQRRLCVSHVSGAKARPNIQTSFQSEKPQCICRRQDISPCKCSKSTTVSSARRLDAEDRHLTSVLSCAYCDFPSTVSKAHLQRDCLRHDMPSVWPCQCTQNFCDADKLGCLETSCTRHESTSLLGRLSFGTSKPSCPCATRRRDYPILNVSGMDNKQRKIVQIPNTTPRVSRNQLAYCQKPKGFANQKDRQDYQPNSIPSKQAKLGCSGGSKLVGMLNFASFSIPLGRLNFRGVQKLLNLLLKDQDIKETIALAREDMIWWMEHLRDSSNIWHSPATHFMVTDASGTGWGAYVDGIHLADTWQNKEMNFHSNVKELTAVLYSLQEFAHTMKNSTLLVQCDNKSAVAYLRKKGGTRSPALLKITQEIYRLVQQHNIYITANYIPGPLNSIADSLSRKKMQPEWHLLARATSVIFQKWGEPKIDLMASANAHVVPSYVSWDIRDRNARFHDAFSRHWRYPIAWVFPPPCLMPKVLAKLNQARGTYIIICPKWENVFWRADLKRRAIAAPFSIKNLRKVLVDTRTNLPPPQVDSLVLEAWKCRGGAIY